MFVSRSHARVWSTVVLSFVVASCGASSVSAPAARSAEPAASLSGSTDPAEHGSSGPPAGTAPSSSYTVSDVAIVPARTSDVPKPSPKPWIETPGFEQVLGKDWVPGYKVMLKVPNQPAGSYVQLVLDGRPVDPVTSFRGGLKLTDLAGPHRIGEGERILAA